MVLSNLDIKSCPAFLIFQFKFSFYFFLSHISHIPILRADRGFLRTEKSFKRYQLCHEFVDSNLSVFKYMDGYSFCAIQFCHEFFFMSAFVQCLKKSKTAPQNNLNANVNNLLFFMFFMSFQPILLFAAWLSEISDSGFMRQTLEK